VCASDVYTMGIVTFLMLGFEEYPMYAADEMPKDGFSFKDYDELTKRSQKRRSLKEILVREFGAGLINAAVVDKIDEAIGACFSQSIGSRPSAEQMQALLDNPEIFLAGGGGGGGSVPKPTGLALGEWFRLVGEGTDDLLTVKKSDPATMRLTRTDAKAIFLTLADESGNPFRKYFNKDQTPGMEFRHVADSDSWQVRVPEGANNTFVHVYLDGGKEVRVEIGKEFVDLRAGKLLLFSRKNGAVVNGCTLVVVPKS
jgi:hypothetical protein